MEINAILSSVQQTAAVHPKYLKEFLDIYKERNVEEFTKDFMSFLMHAFHTDYKIRNPFFDRLLDFLVKFFLSLDSNDSDNSMFLDSIMELIMKCLLVESALVRYNSCVFIQKYITQNELDINGDLYEKLVDALLVRIEDIQPPIRIKAINILKILQLNKEDDSIKMALIDNLADTNGKVRAAIVDSLNPTADVLSHIIARCRDTDDSVRITSFKKLASFSVQNFTIMQRQYILRCGLNEQKSSVKKCVIEILLFSWLKWYELDYMKFLKAIQLDSNDKEIKNTKNVTSLALKVLFDLRPHQEIFETIILEDKLIHLDQLTWESAMYWQNLVKYVKEKQMDDYMEQILPEVVFFCEYIQKFCASSELFTGSIWEQQLYFLILHQLIIIATECDISDEASRRCLQTLFMNLLKYSKLSTDIIQTIVKYFDILIPQSEKRINYFCELVADIRTPLEAKFNQTELNDINMELKQMRDKICYLEADLKATVIENDFIKAQELDIEITKCQEALNNLIIKAEEESVERKVIKICDPEIVSKCLDIIYSMLQSSGTTKMYPTLLSLKDELFKEIMLINNPIIQTKYFKCYGIICSLDKTLSEENIQFLCQPLMFYKTINNSNKELIIAIIACVADIILLYGANILPLSDNDLTEDNKSIDFEILFGKSEATLNDIIDTLSLMFNHEDPDIRECSCEALMKLMIQKRIVSSTLFSQLLVKWLNPATASDVRLRQLLGMFIQIFCQLPDVEIQIEEAFIPTIRTIFLAPDNSPLANLSKDEVLKALIKILNLRNNIDYPIHENLAMALCNEIEKDINDIKECNVFYSKALLWLELRRDNDILIEELLTMSEDIRIESRNRTIIKNLDKFIYSLKYETAE